MIHIKGYKESLTCSIPFRSIAWGGQATRGEYETLALKLGCNRLPRGGVGASEVNPNFHVAHREAAAMQWIKCNRHSVKDTSLIAEIKEALNAAGVASPTAEKKAAKKKLDF